jgi:hypothetical protein
MKNKLLNGRLLNKERNIKILKLFNYLENKALNYGLIMEVGKILFKEIILIVIVFKIYYCYFLRENFINFVWININSNIFF